MVHERYVSFETAKLLKEKGFNEYCLFLYQNNGTFLTAHFTKGDKEKNSNLINEYSAPTQALAMCWLREIHHILISVNIFLPHKPTWIYSYYNLNRGYIRNAGQYNTYEEACEAAIQYCVKHLI